MNTDLRPSYASVVLETPRLLLLGYNESAAKTIFTDEAMETVMQLFALDRPEDYDRVSAMVLAGNDYRGYRLFIIHNKESDEVVGACSYHLWMKQHQRAEIGYAVGEKFRGKGITTEAMKHVLIYGFEQMGLNRVEAFIGPENVPSQKLVVRYGFTREGVLRQHYYKTDRFHDSVCFSLLRHEYEQLQRDW